MRGFWALILTGLVLGSLSYGVPILKHRLSGSSTAIPAALVVLIEVSDLVVSYWYVFGPGFFALVYGIAGAFESRADGDDSRN